VTRWWPSFLFGLPFFDRGYPLVGTHYKLCGVQTHVLYAKLHFIMLSQLAVLTGTEFIHLDY